MSDEQAASDSSNVDRLSKRLDRERRARMEAEAIAERSTSELYHRQQALVLLQAITKASNEAPTVEAAYQTSVDLVCAHMRWPVGHVFAVDGSGKLKPTRIWHLAEPDRFATFRQGTEATSLSPGTGLSGRVLSSKAPAWIANVMSDSNFPRALSAGDLGVRAGFAFPIMVANEVVAVAEFFSPSALPPDERVLDLMRDVGIQLGRAVERSRATEKLIFDAMHDPLTGLPNRALFMDRLQHALTMAKRFPESSFAVLFLDLDRFKVVNDGLGHAVGDDLLKAIGVRLRGAVRATDTLARIGGDEFACLLEHVTDVKQTFIVAEHIHQQLATPFRLGSQEVFVTASIGIAYRDSRQEQPEELLRDADTAMYRAKERGKARHELFDRAMHDEAMARLQLENYLRDAAMRQELRLQYQPIVELGTGEITGFEALVRWQHPHLGLVSPARFIPLAEETGIIVSIGRWVLNEACRQLQLWQRQFGSSRRFTVSVNVSTRQLAQPNFIDEIGGCLRTHELEASRLRLEITESVLMAKPETAALLLSDLRNLGVKVLLDDFGTGYSSLAYLHHLPLDCLKIDGSFVRSMGTGTKGVEMIRTIILLAQSFGLEVVAECVETDAQAAQLRELGCLLGQGYLFARPLDAGAATDRLAAGRQSGQ
jgi:diguanylate cyclase (GGDEF)-like protein